MSTILDSLKKSSDKRGDTQNGSIHNFNFSESGKKTFSSSFLVIIIILITLTILYFGYKYLYPEDNLNNTTQSISVDPNITPKKISLSNEKLETLTTNQDSDKIQKPNSSDVKQEIKDLQNKKSEAKSDTVALVNEAPANEKIGDTTNDFQKLQQPLVAKDPNKPQLKETKSQKSYILAFQLPFNIRKDLPELRLNIHVYDINPLNRIAIINGEKYEIDALVEDSVLVKDIVSEGVLLEFKEYEFLLPKL